MSTDAQYWPDDSDDEEWMKSQGPAHNGDADHAFITVNRNSAFAVGDQTDVHVSARSMVIDVGALQATGKHVIHKDAEAFAPIDLSTLKTFSPSMPYLANDSPPRYMELVRECTQFLHSEPLFRGLAWVRPLSRFHTPTAERESSGQHAREWLSQKCFFSVVRSVLLELNNVMLAPHTADAAATCPYKHHVFTLVPLTGVFGFLQSKMEGGARHDTNSCNHGPRDPTRAAGNFPHRLQRKPDAVACDLNRNLPVLHAHPAGCDSNAGSDVYAGPFALSSVEMEAYTQLAKLPRIRPDFAMDFHSYGNIFLSFPSFGLQKLTYSMLQRVGHDADLAAIAARGPPARGAQDYDAELAYMTLWHAGARRDMKSSIFASMEAHISGYVNDVGSAELGYQTTGALSDWYDAGLGAMGGGVEIGDKNVLFACDSAHGFCHQLSFPTQFTCFLRDAATLQQIRAWKARNADTSDPLHALFRRWQQ